MARSFSFSATAVDFVLEHLKLGRAPFPFRLPHMGTSLEQRAQLREVVFRDLEGKGLMRGGRLDPDAELALQTFVQAPVAIGVVGQLEDETPLYARAASNGRYAVVVRQDGNLLIFEDVRPTNVVPAVVDLLPRAPAGPGQSITLPQPPPRPKNSPDDAFGNVAAPRQRSSPQQRMVERLFEKPKKQMGAVTAFARGRDGKSVSLPPISWFDTEDGRFFCTIRKAEDGGQWITYAPADNARIAQHLQSELQSYL